MIIFDDFITDRAILDEIQASEEFQTPKSWAWWDGWWQAQAGCQRERVVQYIWGEHCPLAAAADFPNSVAGFEYWTLAHQAEPARSAATGSRHIGIGMNSSLPARDNPSSRA